ncbi:MAG: cysteine-rich CWC family protein [Bacteroidota bacterium]
MCKHENKTCPRCHSVFECRLGDITKCPCYTVQLDNAERDFLAGSWSDCLCTSCMQALRTVFSQANNEKRLKQLFGNR